jgi:hypothetical protein
MLTDTWVVYLFWRLVDGKGRWVEGLVLDRRGRLSPPGREGKGTVLYMHLDSVIN